VCTCVHGTCSSAGTCVCYSGFSGDTCQNSDGGGLGTLGLVLIIVLPVVFIGAFMAGSGIVSNIE
jgi:hypothetical protein